MKLKTLLLTLLLSISFTGYTQAGVFLQMLGASDKELLKELENEEDALKALKLTYMSYQIGKAFCTPYGLYDAEQEYNSRERTIQIEDYIFSKHPQSQEKQDELWNSATLKELDQILQFAEMGLIEVDLAIQICTFTYAALGELHTVVFPRDTSVKKDF
ncbi:MAG: hypothetical protein ABGX53_04080 [Candidatus Thioglobus sp.]|jgi:hypothetical protein